MEAYLDCSNGGFVVVIVDLLFTTLHDTQNNWKKVHQRLWQGTRGKGFQKVQRTRCDKIWTKETKAHPRALCRQRRSTSAWQGSQGAPYVTTAPGKTAPSCLIYKTNRHSFSPSTSRRQENRTAPLPTLRKKKEWRVQLVKGQRRGRVDLYWMWPIVSKNVYKGVHSCTTLSLHRQTGGWKSNY